MSTIVDLDVKCEDFLNDNPHLYARKARRKKIALISVQAANPDSAAIRIDLAAAELLVGKHNYHVESPGVILRKFSEFTWDFLVYLILDFHPVLAVVDASIFLTSPLYNRRLKKQLHLLSDGEMLIGPGDCKRVILGFRGVSNGASQLQLSYRRNDGETRQVTCEVRQTAL